MQEIFYFISQNDRSALEFMIRDESVRVRYPIQALQHAAYYGANSALEFLWYNFFHGSQKKLDWIVSDIIGISAEAQKQAYDCLKSPLTLALDQGHTDCIRLISTLDPISITIDNIRRIITCRDIPTLQILTTLRSNDRANIWQEVLKLDDIDFLREVELIPEMAFAKSDAITNIHLALLLGAVSILDYFIAKYQLSIRIDAATVDLLLWHRYCRMLTYVMTHCHMDAPFHAGMCHLGFESCDLSLIMAICNGYRDEFETYVNQKNIYLISYLPKHNQERESYNLFLGQVVRYLCQQGLISKQIQCDILDRCLAWEYYLAAKALVEAGCPVAYEIVKIDLSASHARSFLLQAYAISDIICQIDVAAQPMGFQRLCWINANYGLQKLAANCYVQHFQHIPNAETIPEKVLLRLKVAQQQQLRWKN